MLNCVTDIYSYTENVISMFDELSQPPEKKLNVSYRLIKTRKKAKLRNLYNQAPHLTQDTVWESDKTQENITCKGEKRSALSQQVTTRLQGTDMAGWQRQTQITSKIHKRSTAFEATSHLRGFRKVLSGGGEGVQI